LLLATGQYARRPLGQRSKTDAVQHRQGAFASRDGIETAQFQRVKA
ncbi:MAG: hypothetical protein F6K32_22995, partial [Desertifilum sp. SIO1I2]|nr:hypothetical protein [Desertifilum sp. SIO1I2]